MARKANSYSEMTATSCRLELKFAIALTLVFFHSATYPVSILYKSIAGRYRPVRVADGLITARYRFIKNASYCAFGIFQKVDVCLTLYTEEVNLQNFVMI